MLGLHVDDFFMGLSLPKKENVSQLINVNHNKTRPSHSPSHLVFRCVLHWHQQIDLLSSPSCSLCLYSLIQKLINQSQSEL